MQCQGQPHTNTQEQHSGTCWAIVLRRASHRYHPDISEGGSYNLLYTQFK